MQFPISMIFTQHTAINYARCTFEWEETRTELDQNSKSLPKEILYIKKAKVAWEGGGAVQALQLIFESRKKREYEKFGKWCFHFE